MATTSSYSEVAADFKDYLQDLQPNNRYEINNLTMVAKENTEHAKAIAEAIEQNIKIAPPNRKLASLYVLDSIVKNVGTPYTLYFARGMYRTFMDAYTLVDLSTRRSLEGMLKTWKEPVPGSADIRPVFPPEVTQGLERALNMAKNASANLQAQLPPRPNHLLPPRPPAPSRDSWNKSAVPQGGPSFATQHGLPHLAPSTQRYPSPSPSDAGLRMSTPPVAYGMLAQLPVHIPQSEDGKLESDIDMLIATIMADLVKSPGDLLVQAQLQALAQLQTFVKGRGASQDQKREIRMQVDKLMTTIVSATTLAAAPLPSAPAKWVPSPLPSSAYLAPAQTNHLLPNTSNYAPPLPAPYGDYNPAPPASLGSPFIGQAPPLGLPLGLARPLSPYAAPTPQINPAQQPEANSLMSSLRAAGLLPPNQPPLPINGVPVPPPGWAVPSSGYAMPPSEFPILSHPQQGHPMMPVPSDVPSGRMPLLTTLTARTNIRLTSASLKIPRPYLVDALFTQQPSRCGSCGKRFTFDEKGRARKARHLDWHFRNNQRLADAASRGMSRDLYLDEAKWIQWREVEAGEEAPTPTGIVVQDEANKSAATTSTTTAAHEETEQEAQARKMTRLVRAPDDATANPRKCPICADPLKLICNDDDGDFYWIDAETIGERTYHASCREAVVEDAARNGKPVPAMFGGNKRKAEDDGGNKAKR